MAPRHVWCFCMAAMETREPGAPEEQSGQTTSMSATGRNSCLSVSDDGPPACGWEYFTFVHPDKLSLFLDLRGALPLCPGPPGQTTVDAHFWPHALECAARR